MLTEAISTKFIYPLNSPPSFHFPLYHPTPSPVVCCGLSGLIQMMASRLMKRGLVCPSHWGIHTVGPCYLLSNFFCCYWHRLHRKYSILQLSPTPRPPMAALSPLEDYPKTSKWPGSFHKTCPQSYLQPCLPPFSPCSFPSSHVASLQQLRSTEQALLPGLENSLQFFWFRTPLNNLSQKSLFWLPN